jgi:hypothetical protein
MTYFLYKCHTWRKFHKHQCSFKRKIFRRVGVKKGYITLTVFFLLNMCRSIIGFHFIVLWVLYFFFYLWFWCFDIFFLDFTSIDCYRMYFNSLFFFLKSCFDLFDKSVTLSCQFYGLVSINKFMFHYYCLIFINACTMIPIQHSPE